jgi:hypothetical protein
LTAKAGSASGSRRESCRRTRGARRRSMVCCRCSTCVARRPGLPPGARAAARGGRRGPVLGRPGGQDLPPRWGALYRMDARRRCQAPGDRRPVSRSGRTILGRRAKRAVAARKRGTATSLSGFPIGHSKTGSRAGRRPLDSSLERRAGCVEGLEDILGFGV